MRGSPIILVDPVEPALALALHPASLGFATRSSRPASLQAPSVHDAGRASVRLSGLPSPNEEEETVARVGMHG